MYPIIAIIAALALLCTAKHASTALVLAGIAIAARVLAQRTEQAETAILALGEQDDPWRDPPASTQRLMRRALDTALARTTLTSLYPDAAAAAA